MCEETLLFDSGEGLWIDVRKPSHKDTIKYKGREKADTLMRREKWAV